MALNIENEETEKLAAEIAELTGETEEEAVLRSLRERRGRFGARAPRGPKPRTLEEALHHMETESLAAASQPASRPSPDDESRTGEVAGLRARRLILDSSAVVAIVEEEDGHPRLLEAVAGGSAAIGAPTLFETAMVLVSREDTAGVRALSRFLDDYRVTLLDFDERHVEAAVRAFVRYGKGRHQARLNYGDCMAYAIAKLAGAPLLFVGDDFAKTDLEAA